MPDDFGSPIEEGFFCLDGEWRFTFVNRVTLEFLKRQPEELTGKAIWEEYPGLVGTGFERAGRCVMEKRMAQRVEMKSPTMEAWYHIVIFPMKDGVGVYWRDTTAEKLERETLSANEERMRLFLESYAQSFWEADAYGNRTTMLSLWDDYKGSPSKTIPNTELEKAIHPDDLELALKEYKLAYATGKKIDLEIRIADSEGEWRWMNVLAIPLKDNDGNTIKWVGMNIDISKRKQAELELAASESKYRALTIATSEMMYHLNSDSSELTILLNNGLVKDISGPNKNWLHDYIPPEEHQRIIEAEAIARKDNAIFEMEHRIYLADGSIGWVYTRSVPILDEEGNIIERFGVVNNITERKTIEKNLKTSREHLINMVDRLKQADENRNAFIRTLSHELRNPLAAVSMGLVLLKSARPGSEEAEKAINIMERQTKQLSRLVDDLLDVTRITQNKIQLKTQRVDLNQIIYQVVTDFRPQFTEKGVTLEFELNPDPVFVDVDPARLTQAIVNLLHNAAKFTNKGDKTVVSAGVDEIAEKAVIIVSDTGPGIEPSIQPHLFEPFVQADSSLAHSFGGLGLGLPIVKGIVELHNGSISFQSEGDGTGTQFMILLPLPGIEDGARNNSQARGDEKQTRPLKILVIEDIPDLADILSDLLTHLGHDVVIALSGPEGIKIAKSFHPDVLISDIGLPGMNGYEIAEAFQNDEQLKSIYRIALSGYAQPEDIERSRAAGFRHHLAKPVGIDNLRAVLGEVNIFKPEKVQ